MGPGPTNAHPRILTAQALPLLGHMHPPFIKIMVSPAAAATLHEQRHVMKLSVYQHSTAEGHLGTKAVSINVTCSSDCIAVDCRSQENQARM